MHEIFQFKSVSPEPLILFDVPTLKGDIEPENAEEFIQRLEEEVVTFVSLTEEESNGWNGEVTFVVSSWGGQLDEALIITQDIQRMRETYGVKFKAVAKGYADSAATVVFASADKRIAYSDTEFLIHDPVLKTEEESEQTLTEARYDIYTSRVLKRRAEKLLAKATGKTWQEISAKSKENKPMTAQQALEFGLVNEVRVL